MSSTSGTRRARSPSEDVIDMPVAAAAPAIPPAPGGGAVARRPQPTGARCWCFTHNLDINMSVDQAVTTRPALTDDMDFIACQLEISPTTHRLHWQGYCEFRTKMRMAAMKSQIGNGTHWEVRRGTQDEAIAYTKKPESAIPSTWLEVGKKHQPDATTMLQAAADMILAGSSIRDVAFEKPRVFVMYHRGLTALRDTIAPLPAEQRDVKAWYLYGQSGCGKSLAAQRAFPSSATYRKDKQSHFWQKYSHQHTHLVLDDYYGSMKFCEFLNVVDGYKMILDIKGTDGFAFWTSVTITSNIPKESQYKNLAHDDVKDAIARRLPPERTIYFYRTVDALAAIMPGRRAAATTIRLQRPDWPTDFKEFATPVDAADYVASLIRGDVVWDVPVVREVMDMNQLAHAVMDAE